MFNSCQRTDGRRRGLRLSQSCWRAVLMMRPLQSSFPLAVRSFFFSFSLGGGKAVVTPSKGASGLGSILMSVEVGRWVGRSVGYYYSACQRTWREYSSFTRNNITPRFFFYFTLSVSVSLGPTERPKRNTIISLHRAASMAHQTICLKFFRAARVEVLLLFI